MKNSRFILLYVVFVAGCLVISALGQGLKITDPQFVLQMAFVTFLYAFLIGSIALNDLGDWQKEREAQIRVANNSPQRDEGKRAFKLEAARSIWLYVGVAVIPVAVIFMMPADNKLVFILFTLVMTALSGLFLFRAFNMPTSFEVTPEALVIKRRWPCSSPAIYLDEIDQLQFEWSQDNTFSALGIRNKLIGIRFTMKDGEKYSVDLDIYFPSSIERLVQVLRSRVKAEPVSTGRIPYFY